LVKVLINVKAPLNRKKIFFLNLTNIDLKIIMLDHQKKKKIYIYIIVETNVETLEHHESCKKF